MARKHARTRILGVGINDADYNVYWTVYSTDEFGNELTTQKVCPYYGKWKAMLTRVYCKKLKAKYPSYTECSVIPEWLYFSNFKAWMEQQDWQGKELDKDILIEGNKHYSPETCVFVSSRVNKFMITYKKGTTELPLGVIWEECYQKYTATSRSMETGKNKFVGYFDDPFEAHVAWRKYKVEQAIILVEKENLTGVIAKAIIDRFKPLPLFRTDKGEWKCEEIGGGK